MNAVIPARKSGWIEMSLLGSLGTGKLSCIPARKSGWIEIVIIIYSLSGLIFPLARAGG
jgi:hypothetical protein